ncbi:MAG: hypothetical protein IKZ05_03535 [Clostridia bacterium]|nr:hypothetical protein [Clostridia bacterium]
MLEKKISVASFDVYPNSTIKPSALQRYMQQLAREDCDAMGCTYSNMREVNMVFVLVKLGIEIKKPVFAYDELTVRTFHNSVSGITSLREFEFYRDGEKIIHATTQWVIVKYDTRRLVRPKEFPFELYEHNIECESIDLPRSLVTTELEKRGERVVRLSDLDENDHLNNCVYSDITLDFLPYDRKEDYVKSIRIIFNHEAKLGDVLSVSVGENNGVFAVSAQNTTGESKCFEADCVLGKI